jgi:hypothetical protein
MSLMGPRGHCGDVGRMTALPLKAEVHPRTRHLAQVAEAVIAAFAERMLRNIGSSAGIVRGWGIFPVRQSFWQAENLGRSKICARSPSQARLRAPLIIGPSRQHRQTVGRNLAKSGAEPLRRERWWRAAAVQPDRRSDGAVPVPMPPYHTPRNATRAQIRRMPKTVR